MAFVIIIFLILQTLSMESCIIPACPDWWLADILSFYRWGVSGSSERHSQRTRKLKYWTSLHVSGAVLEPIPRPLFCEADDLYTWQADTKAEPCIQYAEMGLPQLSSLIKTGVFCWFVLFVKLVINVLGGHSLHKTNMDVFLRHLDGYNRSNVSINLLSWLRGKRTWNSAWKYELGLGFSVSFL